MSQRCGKKRKLPVDHEAERTLYKEFASAAASVSQLFSSAVAQQRKATAQGSRQALERVLTWVLKEHQGLEMISKSELVQFLQQEYQESSEGQDSHIQVPNPFHGQGNSAEALDLHASVGKPARSAFHAPIASGPSPPQRRHSGSMDDEQDTATLEPHQPAAHFRHDPHQQQQPQQRSHAMGMPSLQAFGGFAPSAGAAYHGHQSHAQQQQQHAGPQPGFGGGFC